MGKVHFRPLIQIISLMVIMAVVIIHIAIGTLFYGPYGSGTYFGYTHPNYYSVGHSGSGFYSSYTMQGYGTYYGPNMPQYSPYGEPYGAGLNYSVITSTKLRKNMVLENILGPRL